ncbi:Putative ribokinase [Sporothrix bragantina]|uniref:Ribokinase n=1 Tax=Sporothrix bragantina TaxID=671064 RepID=A0ABP0B6D0_9PEZI
MASSTSASADGLPRITVLGSLNMDLVSYVSHHPEPGETMTSNGFAVSPGGKGANQAIACAKLSRERTVDKDGKPIQPTASTSKPTAHVSMAGAVGDDAHGTALRANLAAHGVDVSGVQTAPAGVPSGVAVIVVDEPTGQNRIIFSPGANYQIDTTKSASLVPAGTQLLILQLEIPLDQVLRALKEARAAGVPVLLNPAPAPATEEARAKLEAAFAVASPEEKGLAHLVLNETETAALVPELTVADLDTTAGLSRAASYFLARGVENIVMTLGGRGVYYATQAQKGQDVVGELLPPEKVKQVVDTTGAGDTFAGQYALEAVYATAAGTPFDCAAAVRKSNRAAAMTVQRKGAQDSIPWRDEVV